MKKFMKKTEGFTLVELIVVIAILGILAGVGTVGYSGYIKKANEAADNQLLAAVNQAFAMACIENGDDINSRSGATMKLMGEAGARKVDMTQVSPYKEAFAKYYAGNEESTFKMFTTLVFDSTKHLFVNPASAGYQSFTFGSGVVYISPEDAAALGASTFFDESAGLGAQGLMDKVNYVTGLAAGFDSDAYINMFADEDYLRSAAGAFGVDTTGMNYEQLAAAWEGKLAEYSAVKFEEMTGKKLADIDFDTLSEADRQYYEDKIAEADSLILANTAVLYAAQKVPQQSQTDILNMLTSANPKATIQASMQDDIGEGLSQAALVYGLYTAYAYSNGSEDLINNTDNPIEILKSLDWTKEENAGFKTYLQGEQAKADLAGYMSAMNMINSSTGDPDAVAKVLTNGFGDPDLVKLLEDAVG